MLSRNNRVQKLSATRAPFLMRRLRWPVLLTTVFASVGISVCEAGLKIYYIRHAEGGHNVRAAWEESGTPESEWPDYVGDHNQFTPLGKKQQAAVSQKLQELEYRFDFIACSPAWRSRNTILPYLKDTGSKGEIWPELQELSISSDYLFRTDLPDVDPETVLGAGPPIELPEDETEWFSIRKGETNEFQIPREFEDDGEEEAAAGVLVYKKAIDLLLKRFNGTDKTILLAGHGASGNKLIELFTKDVSFSSIDNTGIWLIEQQEDGSFNAKMYNSAPLATGPVNGKLEVRFSDMRADLSDAAINGKSEKDPNVTISKSAQDLDMIYSLAIKNQDLDGLGSPNDSLSWDIRVQGYRGGDITLDGANSSVKLGAPSEARSSDDYFGVSDKRYVEEDDSIQFSVENVVLKSDGGGSVAFKGFDGLYGTDDSYVFGVGENGLASQVTEEDDEFTFAPTKVLTLSCPTDKFRIRDLTGSFLISSDAWVSFRRPWARLPACAPNTEYHGTLAGLASGKDLQYSKLSGPDWLTVAPDGTLTGIPTPNNTGDQVFQIQASNKSGAKDSIKAVVLVE